MKLHMIRKILLLLGMISLVLAPGAVLSAPFMADHSPLIMSQIDGAGSPAADCFGMDCNGIEFTDCEMAACTMAGCAFSFLSETPTASWVNASLTNAPGAPPFLTGLSRHNLPLPPP
ncbi:MAG: hypothetical protein IH995_04225 [Proteobacteria bacterium]|nr:hypothetical protein [Pseudomonadota bacterium]